MSEDLEHFKKLAATNRRSENLADCEDLLVHIANKLDRCADCSDLSQQIRAICIEVGQRR